MLHVSCCTFVLLLNYAFAYCATVKCKCSALRAHLPAQPAFSHLQTSCSETFVLIYRSVLKLAKWYRCDATCRNLLEGLHNFSIVCVISSCLVLEISTFEWGVLGGRCSRNSSVVLQPDLRSAKTRVLKSKMRVPKHQGAPKGRQQKGETGPGTHIFADFCRFSLIFGSLCK